MLNQRLRDLLSSPVLDDPGSDRLARVLYPIAGSVAGIVMLLACAVAHPAVTDRPGPAWLIQLSILMLMLAVLWMLRRGQVWLAALVFSCALWGIVSVVTFLMGGIVSPTVATYVLVAVLAGFVWGERGVVAFSIATGVAGLGLVWAHHAGRVPPPLSPVSPAYGWLVLVSSLSVLSVLIVVSLRVTKSAQRELSLREEQLRQAQKMEAIGRFAGGIAHDFNNLLMAIGGHNDFLISELGQRHPALEEAREVKGATERAASLTRQILAFSRDQVQQARAIDLNEVVDRTRALLTRLIGADVELATELEPGLPPVCADPFQLEQLLLNLAANARDAMVRGGELRIETRGERRQHGEVQVLLTVSDTGAGMDEATRERIFEPFFTTKDPGRGTGLGLSSVYSIVKRSRGKISVASQPGSGTRVSIVLPGVMQSAPEPATAPQESPRQGCETLLLAEDDDMVRRMIRRVLDGSGYRVLEASNGAEALELARKHDGPIHLVVTDVVMPKLGGIGLAEELKRSRPEARMLFVSGYTDIGSERNRSLSAAGPVLWKPFTGEVLTAQVRSLLDASAAISAS